MRKGKFISALCKCLVISILASVAAACSDSEPKGMTASEEYDIAFVTRFGIPDRDHTWSMARDKAITLITPNGAGEVKVYGLQDNEYRLLAHYSNVGSMAQIKFVAPGDMQTVLVSADGCLCEAEVDGMVSIAKAASRSYTAEAVEEIGGKYYVKATKSESSYTAAQLFNLFCTKARKDSSNETEIYAPDNEIYRNQEGKIVSFISKTIGVSPGHNVVFTNGDNEVKDLKYFKGEYYECYAAGDAYEYERKAYTLQDDKDGKGPYFIKIDDTPYTWILAAEDLGAKDDWDFNDVVLGVTCVAKGANSYDVTVTGLAAGGTLPVKIYYKNEVLKPGGREEFHSWFGPSPNTYKSSDMINTGSGPETAVLSAVAFTTTEQPLTEDWSANAVNNGSLGGFRIEVEGNADTMTGANKNKNSVAPQMICVDGAWKWPTERVAIDEAYPSDETGNKVGFTKWVADPKVTTWIQNAVGSKVYKAKK